MNLFFAVFAWTLVIFGLASVLRTLYRGTTTVRRLHQIPCAKCQYFTRHYVLKCTVNPHIALTEAAINCHDYDA